jgi:hypothetical protein
MTIFDIYEAAKERGLARSKRDFSTAYLGSAPNYLADAGFDGCSVRALVHLCRHLGAERQADLQAIALRRLLDAEANYRRTKAVRA